MTLASPFMVGIPWLGSLADEWLAGAPSCWNHSKVAGLCTCGKGRGAKMPAKSQVNPTGKIDQARCRPLGQHVQAVAAGRQRLVHDPADGRGAPAALGAAAEAAVDLAGRSRGVSAATAVRTSWSRQHVAGTDNHRQPARPTWFQLQLSYFRRHARAKGKRAHLHVFQSEIVRYVENRARTIRRDASGSHAVGQTACAGSRARVGQRVDDAVDDLLDQDAVVALAHDADHRLGAGGAHDAGGHGR